ncbi:MAG: DUF397 domain-containing protein [Nocardiopsaceae bacterium]|nr:DUF397 domain-containing protein [Nocardiopsaceae bacterium]
MDSIDPRWRKSTFSGGNGGGCVEAGNGRGGVLVRDTTQAGQPDRPVVPFSAGAWAEFTARLKKLTTDVRDIPGIGQDAAAVLRSRRQSDGWGAGRATGLSRTSAPCRSRRRGTRS